MAITNGAAVAADLQTYFSKELLKLTEYVTVLKNYAYQEALPANSSKTISFTQYANLTPPAGILTDGVTPSDDILSTTAITATVDQVGQYVTITDLAQLTVKHPLMTQLMQNLSISAGRSYDTRIQTVLVAGTAVQYANGKASRILTAATDVMTTAEFSKAVARLRKNAGTPFEDGNYVLVVDPSVEQDIVNDTKFFTAAQYSQVQRVNQNEVGTWMGLRVVRSNNIPVITGAGASGADIHTSYVFARNAYAVTDLQSLEMYVESEGGTADPLHQRKTAGFKYSMKAVILNQNWMGRIESGSAY